MKKSLVCLIIWICYSCTSSSAQQNNYRFEHLNKANGLSNTTIQVIYMDRYGFLWIGTENGLNRFDGKTMTVYKAGTDSTTLWNNKILSIKEDPQGNLWIGAVVGLHKYNRSKDNFERFPIVEGNAGLSDKSINDFFWDQQSNIWIGTSKGLNRINLKTKKIKRWFDKKTPTSNEERITGIVQDKNGKLWISTFHGLKCYEPKTESFTTFAADASKPNTLSNNLIYDIKLDQDGFLWVATQNGLNQFDTKTKDVKRFLHRSNDANSILSSEVNMSYRYGKQVFVATLEGLSVIDLTSGKIENVSPTDEQGLSSKIIQAVYVDRYGSLWVGSKFGGLDFYSKYANKFTHYHHTPNDPNGLSYNLISGFSEDHKQNIWISTDGGGLNCFDKKQGTFTHYFNLPGNSNSISTNKTLFNRIDKDQKLWICTWAGGLNRYDLTSKKFQHFRNNPKDTNSLSTDCPYYVYQDSDGEIWVGLWNGGFNQYDQKRQQFIRYPLAKEGHKELRSIGITSIVEDKDKNLWLGTEGYGIYVYNKRNGSYTLYSYTNTNPWDLRGNEISVLFRDSKDRIWVGTNGAGLSVYDPNSKQFKLPENVRNQMSNAITGIVEDNMHNLWLSSGNGISKLSWIEKNGKPEFSLKSYNKSDGLQDLQFVRWAFYKTRSGDILFGGQNGFNLFTPDSIKDNPFVPRVYFTQFLLFNKPVPIGDSSIIKENITYSKEIRLTHRESVFTFQFCALNYVNSWKNQFACKMEGFNKDWIYLEGKNEATYTNLDPGTYTFKVKACNNDGIWSTEPAEIRIIVLPPWWKTWWFRSFVIASVLGMIIGYFLIRMKNIRLQKEHLERLVAIRTKELSSANAILMEQKEELFQQSEEIASQRDELELQNAQITKAFNNNKLLSEFGQKITAKLNAKTIQSTIYEYIHSLINISIFGIGIYDPRKNVLVFEDFINGEYQYNHILQHLRLESYISDCVSNKAEILITSKDQIDVHRLKIGNKNLDEQLQTLFLIPLMSENNAIGVMIVGSRQENEYASNEINTLRTLGSYLAIALDNAHAYGVISVKNGLIEGSIRYAENIQRAILPPRLLIESYFESFVLFQPRDVVSGDFYWFNSVKLEGREFIYAAVIDCTGHGVPGAFMSMIGKSLINEIVNEKKIYSPAEILTELNISIGKALRQKETGNNDGMDVCLCRFEPRAEPERPYRCIYAGAKLPVYQFCAATQEMVTHQGTKRSIGGTNLIKEEPFIEMEVELSKNDCIYLSSDGYRDQNNAERKRLGSKRMLDCIGSSAEQSMEKQKGILEQFLIEYSQNEEQRDDITVWGIRI